MSAARTALAALGLAALAAAGFGAAAPASLSAQAPRVDSMTILSSAGNDSTYTRGDTIRVRVYWSRRLDLTGSTATTGLTIGSANRTATYGGDPGTIGYTAASSNSVGNVWLNYHYLVQQSDLDTDGISVVSVGSSELQDFSDNTAANTDVTGKTITNAAAHKVDGAQGLPRVTGVTISSDAGNDSLYLTGDTIQASVVFDSTVTVTGTPQLALTIGTTTRQANYASGTGSATLVFRYVVVNADVDADGISIAANALTLNGGTIRDGTLNAHLDLGSHAISNAAAHKVGSPPATVTGVSIGSPPVGDTFERGDTVVVTVTFDTTMAVTGTPRVALWIGAATRQASYASGTGTTSLAFRYLVVQTDADTDGISIGQYALGLNGGAIRTQGTTTDASLPLVASGNAVTNSAGHKVTGGLTGSPVSGVTITSTPASGGTYILGERIEVDVSFPRTVDVTGSPQLALTIGSATRQAVYLSGTGTKTLAFGYLIADTADADANGISIAANALNGGTIVDGRDGTTVVSRPLGTNAVSNAAAHRVDASLGTGVTALAVASPPTDSTFERSDGITVTVTFSKAVDVTGTPRLALAIGTPTRLASYASGTGTASLVFQYTVVQADSDTDGLSIGLAALQLNGGQIRVAGTTRDAYLNLAGHTIANSGNYLVDGARTTTPAVDGVAVTSNPGSGTYIRTQQITVEVTFARPVTVTGTPQLALGIGTQTRQASYTSSDATNTRLTFGYTVQAADTDADGISVGASALTLNGGTINDARVSTAASLGLGSNTLSNASGHAVDGSEGPPEVSGVSIASPPIGDTFERGDTVVVTVTFDKPVDVTGAPQLALTIGSGTKQAAYASGTGTASLVFRHVVVTADVDTDGLSIGATALALNGGMIDVAGGTVDAVLGLGSHAITNSAGHKVAGGTFTAASVSGMSLTSSPAVSDTYGRDEQIEVQVTFNRRVTVTGAPQVALTVGAATRQAAYASGTGTDTLTFQYTVVAADADTDGIEVGASALALNSGTINDGRDGATAAALGLGSHALSAASGHKVDGTLTGASVTGVAVSSTPESGNTYGLGERIEVQVTFDRAVTVTGSPQLALTVGTVARQAAYAGGSGTATLSFAYHVQGAGSGGSGTGGVDADTDGVAVAAGALTANGATLVNTADGVRPAVLGLGSHVIAAAANDRVDGTVEATPVVMGMAVSSTPGAGGVYGPGSTIRLAVTFSRPVEVVGRAQLAIEVGSLMRRAAYASGSGTTVLVFEYVVQPSDRDSDGISIPADALTVEGEAVVRIAGGTTAATLDLGSHAVEDLEGHQVSGAGGTDPVFGRAEYEFEMTEDVPGPLVLGTVSATDPLGGAVTYSLAAGDEGLFEVDAREGTVRYVGAGEDAEARSEFVMTARATSADGERTGDATVTVRLRNVNDAPVFVSERYAFAFAENVAGPLVLGAVEAVDLDEGDTVTYRMASGDADRFALDGATGEVRYVGGGEDYEAGPKSWELSVTATDLAGLRAEAVVSVTLTNVNEGPAFADSAYAFELAENVRGPLRLGAVHATDPDGGDWMSYALVSGDAERFKVNATSGAVQYVGAGEDAETGPGSWELVVTATDRGGLVARVPVVVSLLDRNEGPTFVESSYAWELRENVPGPVELGAVEATDADAGDTLRYSLTGTGAALFAVDESSGVVRYVGAGEDAETGPAGWEFQVVATDREGLAAVATAEVALLDVNEAPAFVDSAYAFELSENVPGPRDLGRVEATDPDRDEVLTYTMAQGDAARFRVDGASGQVRYVGGGEDYEGGPPEFALVVRVTDAGGLTDDAAVVVTLLNVNEGPEAVGALPSPPALELGGTPWEVDLAPYFRDPDGDALSYVVVSSAPSVASASVSGAGRLSVAPREIGATVVTVTASDAAGLSATQQASVTVEASRAERARALKLTLAAFGRSLGTETVEAIGGRLGLESSGPMGRSHVQVGGRSLSCAVFGQDESSTRGESGARGSRCGLESLVRDVSGLLGLQFNVPGAGPGSPGGAGGTLDLADVLFGNGATGLGSAPGASFGLGGPHQGQRQAHPGRNERGGLAVSPLGGRDLRSQSSFQLSFGGGSAGPNGGASGSAHGTPPGQTASQPRWTLWGQANLGEFEGRPEDNFAMDGRTRSAYLGLDYRLGSGFLVGLAGSRSDMKANYESGINGAGTSKAHLNSLYPYASWSSQDGLAIWGLLGAGAGAANVGEPDRTFDADLQMRMGALGVRQQLVRGLALKADAFVVRMTTDASEGPGVTHVAGVTAGAQRVRLAPELGGQWMRGNMAVRTRVEVGGRYDGGDAETGMGAEAGAQLGLAHQGSGLSLDVRGRMLLVHQEKDFRDWGAAVALRMQPGRGDDGGLSLSVEPSWGNASGGAQTLWQGGSDVWRSAAMPAALGARVPASIPGGPALAGDPANLGGPTGEGAAHGIPAAYGLLAQDAPSWAPDRLAMEVGYGVLLPGGRQIKPFGRWRRVGPAAYSLNVGTRWAMLGAETGEDPGLRLMMDVFGEQVADGLRPPERRVGLLGKITFE